MHPLLTNPRTTMVRYTNETGAHTFQHDPRNEREFHLRIVERLTPETRLVILWLKDLWHSTPLYPTSVGSIDSYYAVLDHGVRTPDEFDHHLWSHGKPTLAEAEAVRVNARDA